MEKAIVSSDVGDVRKFIENGVNGFLVEKGDAVGFADNIKKLIEKQIQELISVRLQEKLQKINLI